MPKTPRYRQHQNNYYGNDGYGRNQYWGYNNRNQNNYNARYNEDYGAGYHNTYKSRWQSNNDVGGESSRRNYSTNNNWKKKNWKGGQNHKQNHIGQNQKTADENKTNTSNQSANRLLTALDKTAESVTNNKANGVSIKKLTQPTTAPQTVEKEGSKTPLLKEANENKTNTLNQPTTAPQTVEKEGSKTPLLKEANENKTNKSNQSANRLLTVLDKTAESVTNNKANGVSIKKVTQPTTAPQTVEKERPKTPLLKEANESKTEVATKKQLEEINFQKFLEEAVMKYKYAMYAQRVEEYIDKDTCDASTIKVMFDEVALKEMKERQAHQAKEREELIKKTKETRLYKVYKERTKETDVPSENIPKTPDISIAASRWKETYFKPWKLQLAQVGHRFLDGIDEDDDDIDEQ